MNTKEKDISKNWTISDQIFQILTERGITDIFLLPGGGCMYMVDAIARNKKIYPRVLMHEQSVGIAAESYAQFKNSPSVALVTTGPGGTNAITPCAAAWTDSTPMLFISGQVKTTDASETYSVRQMGFQEIPITEIVKPITKKAFKMSLKDDIYTVLTNLLDLAIEGRPGPVWLDIPLDIQNFPYPLDKRDQNSESFHFTNSVDSIPMASKLTTEISEIKLELSKSNKPVILLGNGVRLSGCTDIAISFANALKIPVLLTWKMMDILDESDPINAGRPGAIPQPWSNKIQEEADLILSIGARIDTGQSAYNLNTYGKKALKIVVDIDSNELAKFPSAGNYKLINQNANIVIRELIDKCQSFEMSEKWNSWRKQVWELKKQYSGIFYERKSPNYGVNLYNFIRILSNLLAKDAILVPGSSGACSEIVMQAFQVKKGQRILNSEGLGSMGFGISAAFGVHVASGGQNIICIDGDGGFQMNIQELATVALHAKNMTFFVLNNNGYGSIKTTQDKYFSGRRIGTDPTSGLALIDLSQIAGSFGLGYWKMETENNMESIICEVLNSNSNSIVEIIVDEYQETSPKVVSTRNDKGEFIPVDMSLFQY